MWSFPTPIFIISGHNFCGKSVVGNFLSKRNFAIVECGEIVKSLMAESGYTGSSCQYNEKMKDEIGPSFLTKHILRQLLRIRNTTVSGIAILGVRSIELYYTLIKFFPWALTIYIESSRENRINRYQSIHGHLKKSAPEKNNQEFSKRDVLHDKWGLKEIRIKAEILIQNDDTISDLFDELISRVMIPNSLLTDISISSTASIGRNCQLYDRVEIEDDVIIEENVSIGHPMPSSKKDKNKKDKTITVIGKGSVIRSGCIIYEGSILGSNIDCAHYVIIRENCVIGDNTYITPFTTIKSDVKTGVNCRLGGIVSDRTILEDNVTSLGMLVHKFKPRQGGFIEEAPIVKENTVVGRGAIVIGGISVGPNAFIGGGTIVTQNINRDEKVVMEINLRKIGGR